MPQQTGQMASNMGTMMTLIRDLEVSKKKNWIRLHFDSNSSQPLPSKSFLDIGSWLHPTPKSWFYWPLNLIPWLWSWWKIQFLWLQNLSNFGVIFRLRPLTPSDSRVIIILIWILIPQLWNEFKIYWLQLRLDSETEPELESFWNHFDSNSGSLRFTHCQLK